jgi:HEXXH motif-containing protein
MRSVEEGPLQVSTMDILRTAKPVDLPLSREHFDTLAASAGDEHTVTALLRGEWSWRLATLRALLDTVNEHGAACAPLVPTSEAWALLARSQKRSPGPIETLVRWPQVGVWAAYTMRRIRGHARSDNPLWTDIGYLHAIAAVAAILAGIDFELDIPARDGGAVLPSLGYAVLPAADRWDVAHVAASGSSVRLTCRTSTVDLVRTDTIHSSSPWWHGIRSLSTQSAGLTLRTAIDDIDPYRSLKDSAPPNRLPPQGLERWRSLLEDAWKLLTRYHSHHARAIAAGLVSIAPLPRGEPFRPLSASADQGYGTILSSEPENAAQLAMTLIHESQHNQLGALLHLADFHAEHTGEPLYAPWRDDPRPLGGVFQGMYAFVGITDFWRVHRTVAVGADADLAHFEFALWRQQTSRTLALVRKHPVLNEVGAEFADGLLTHAAAWQHETVPSHLQALADVSADDHHALWRTYHHRPAGHEVERLAKAWLAGQPCPPVASSIDSAVIDDPQGRWLDARAVLSRLALVNAPALRTGQDHDTDAAALVSGATAADVVFAGGNVQRARRLYLERLAAAPDDAVAWTGLRLTWTSAPLILRDRPELVRAVGSALLRMDITAAPIDLVMWMGEAAPRTH